MRVYGIDLDGVLAKTPAELIYRNEDLAQLLQVKPYRDNVEVMHEWTFCGMVPSLLMYRSPLTRVITEAWCAEHHVPYSNFLVGVEVSDVAQCVYHIDASFYVTANVENALETAVSGVNTYIVRREWNTADEDSLTNMYENIRFINKLREITKLERIEAKT